MEDFPLAFNRIKKIEQRLINYLEVGLKTIFYSTVLTKAKYVYNFL